MNKLLKFVEDFNEFSYEKEKYSPELNFESNGYDSFISYENEFSIFDDQAYKNILSLIDDQINNLYILKRNLNDFIYSMPKEEFKEKYGSINEET